MRRLVALCAIACGIAGFGGPAAAAPVAPGAACNGSSGVTVVVDFGSLGGGTQVRCAPGDPPNGLAALSAAGFSYGFVEGQPGLVCVIDRKPDPCNGAPASAYWAYHHAQPGGSWSYSNEGAGTYDPAPGSVEGWAFGDDRRPSVAPPASSPTTTSPTTTSPSTAPAPPPSSRPATSTPPSAGAPTAPPPTASVGGGATADDGSPSSVAGDAGAGDAGRVGTDDTDDAATTTTSIATSIATSSEPTEQDDVTGAATDDEAALADGGAEETGDGIGTGTVVGALVVLLVTSGAVLERRRRTAT